MDDLISRALALEVIEAVKHITWSQSGRVLCGKMYSQIKNLPAVDAIPVTRCKDCKHSEFWYRDKRICRLWNEDGIDVFEDGFCNYGTRREQDG